MRVWPPAGRCGRIQRFLQSWAGAGASGITFPAPLSREMRNLKPKNSHCPEKGIGHRVEWASPQQRCVQDGWPALWVIREVSCGTQTDGVSQMQRRLTFGLRGGKPAARGLEATDELPWDTSPSGSQIE